MVHLFIHCLFNANTQDREIDNCLISRGSFITSIRGLQRETGLSMQCLRSCLKNLQSTQEITQTSTQKDTIINLLKYDSYAVPQRKANTGSNTATNTEVISQSTEYQHLSEVPTQAAVNVSLCNETDCKGQKEQGNTATNTETNTHTQRKEKENKQEKEISPHTPYIETEINKEKEKKSNDFFPLACEKGIINSQSGEKKSLESKTITTTHEKKKNFSKKVCVFVCVQSHVRNAHTYATHNTKIKKMIFSKKKLKLLCKLKTFHRSTNFQKKKKVPPKKKKSYTGTTNLNNTTRE
jgi:hypothetical protein